MSKSILIIGINYSPELTGIGKYTAEFANYLASVRGFNLTVITGVPYYPQWSVYKGYRNKFLKEDIKGVNIFRSPLFIPSKPSGGKRLIQDFLFFICSFLLMTRFIIARKRFDIVFIPVPSFALGLIGIYYRAFFKKSKVIYHIQDLQVDAAEKLGMIKSGTLIKLLFRIEKYILETVDMVSTISQGMKDKILSKSDILKKCLIFPNWIDSSNIYPLIGEVVINSSLFKNKKIIFYSGAVGEKQGLEMIIDTANFFKDNTELIFVISGEGPYKEKLQAYAETKKITNLIFLNLLPIEEFNKMLNASFIHLVIQKESGSDLFLPSKLTNILGVGGCVIVTASPGTSLFEIINCNKCGYLIPPSNLENLCDTIKKLYQNDTLRNELKENAISYAKKNLYKANVIEKFLEEIN